MNKYLLSLLAALVIGSVAVAAPTYVRFEGTIVSDYDENAVLYEDGALYTAHPSFGLSPGQEVWFDFVFDQSVESPGRTDDGFRDYFYAEYLGGSTPMGGEVWGQDNYYAGPSSGHMIIETAPGQRMLFGWLYNGSGDNVLRTVETWQVGGPPFVSLGANRDWLDADISRTFNITYLDSVPPPAIVPLPIAFYLFASALGLLGFVQRKRD